MKSKTPKTEHFCKYCGQKFLGRADAQYCSASCNSMARRKRRLQREQNGEKPFVRRSQYKTIRPQAAPIQGLQDENMPSFGAFLLTGLAVAAIDGAFSPKKTRKSSR